MLTVMDMHFLSPAPYLGAGIRLPTKLGKLPHASPGAQRSKRCVTPLVRSYPCIGPSPLGLQASARAREPLGQSIGDQLDQRAQPFGLLLRIASAMRPPSSCACRA